MRRLHLLAIVLSALIVVGAGHGLGPLILIELFSLKQLIFGDLEFNILGRYSERLPTVGLLAFVGQSILSIVFFFSGKARSILTTLGCLVLLIAIVILTQDAGDTSLAMMSLLFSMPSGVMALLLGVVEVKNLVSGDTGDLKK